ncbi:hypothetical protein MKX01_019513 [Papaver californicum]|nr:hypothetical protein MKX01_019513 [Papaver californicum]
MLIHRLLAEGDPAYEQEIIFAMRHGTRLLNMSDFRDKRSNSSAWDFSSFVRTCALYLDEQLELRMQGRRCCNPSIPILVPPTATLTSTSFVTAGSRNENRRDFTRAQHLQNLVNRFLACRPTGAARNYRVVIVALYSIVKDSFEIYTDLTDIIAILIDRFLELEINECAKVHDIFTRAAKQFDELDAFYNNNTNASEDREDKLALALFDGSGATTTAEPAWEAFPDDSPGGWETSLVLTSSNLKNHTPKLGGGFNSPLLNGMYQQHAAAMVTAISLATGSASSVAFGSTGKPGSTMLALPASPVSSSAGNDINNNSTFNVVNAEPFAASLAMEKKQRLLMEEQLMWQQYARDGMQGHIALKKSCQANPYGMGGYSAQSY